MLKEPENKIKTSRKEKEYKNNKKKISIGENSMLHTRYRV
jgi:hypothetical protein